jgi:hypothetical protein
MGEAANITDVREMESGEIEGAIYFRTRCADEYPKDERNEVTAEMLQTVALPYVQGLADDDPLLARYAVAFEMCRDIENRPESDWLESSWEWDRFGYGMRTDDPAEWLQHRVDEIERFVADQLRDVSNPEVAGYIQPPGWAVNDAREMFERLRGVEPSDDDWSVIHYMAWKITDLMDAEPVTDDEIEAEIARHEDAIRRITEAGVTCLDEVPEED